MSTAVVNKCCVVCGRSPDEAVPEPGTSDRLDFNRGRPVRCPCGHAYRQRFAGWRTHNIPYEERHIVEERLGEHGCDGHDFMFQRMLYHWTWRVTPPYTQTHLDIGCGMGGFLRASRDRGFSPTGAEACATLANWVGDRYHYPVVLTSTCDELRGYDLYDVVSLVEVVEHLTDDEPEKLLAAARRLVRADTGVLFVTTPNFDSRNRKAAGWDHWYQCTKMIRGHIEFYNAGSLRALVERHGFEVVHLWTEGDDDQLMMVARTRHAR